jgi:hypothetical protein
MTAARPALPWYIHPAEDPEAWRRLAETTPRPSFVVANVHDGPGKPDDPWYPEALALLRGLRVLGYVDLAYGERSLEDVLQDVQDWQRRYRVGGVMFDRCPSDAASTERLSAYVAGARRAGAGFVVGNPGVVPALGHLALMDVTCVFEGTAEQYAGFRPPPALARLPRSRIWHLVHTCPPDEVAEVTARAARLGAGHAFVTDRLMPNPWAGFPLGAAPAARAVAPR